jgi:hypothetical protein
LEQVHSPGFPDRQRRKFYVRGYGKGTPAEFLRSRGHHVSDDDIIRHIIGAAPEGGPLFESFVDATADMLFEGDADQGSRYQCIYPLRRQVT